MTLTNIDAGIKDFTVHRPTPVFRIDGDIFQCVPNLPALALLDFSTIAEKVSQGSNDVDATQKMFSEMFQLVLTEESADLFLARLRDKANPISIDQVNAVLDWVMAEFGMRPTQPSPSSSDGSVTPDDGARLTGTVPAGASISAPLIVPIS